MAIDVKTHKVDLLVSGYNSQQDHQNIRNTCEGIYRGFTVREYYNNHYKEWYQWLLDTNKGTLKSKWVFVDIKRKFDGKSKLHQINIYNLIFYVDFQNPDDELIFQLMWKGNL